MKVRDTEAGRRGLPDPSGGAVFGRKMLDGDDNTVSVYRRPGQEYETKNVAPAFQGLRDGRRAAGSIATAHEDDFAYVTGGIAARSSAEDDVVEREVPCAIGACRRRALGRGDRDASLARALTDPAGGTVYGRRVGKSEPDGKSGR